MSTIAINSLEDAIAFLQANDDNAAYTLAGEFFQLKIKVDGARYHSSIPGELARGLWQFQEALYKAVAFSLHGVEDIRKLTAEQREDFELNFEVREGSTELLASIGKFIEKLGDGITTMSSKDKKHTILVIAVLLAGGLGIHDYWGHQADMARIDAEAESARMTAEANAQTVQAIASLAGSNEKVKIFQKAIDEGGQAVVKGADDATTIQVPGKTYTRSDIEELTQRAPRELARAVSDIRQYKIVTTNSKSMDFIKLGLVDVETGEVIPVSFIRDNMTMEDNNDIWEAAKSGNPITLELSKNYRKDALILASILSVRRPEAGTTQVAEKQ